MNSGLQISPKEYHSKANTMPITSRHPFYIAPLQVANKAWQPHEYKSVLVLYSGEGNPPGEYFLYKLYLDEDSPPVAEFEPPLKLSPSTVGAVVEVLENIPEIPFHIPPGSGAWVLHQAGWAVNSNDF